jgi:hypothetical protein
MRHHSFRTLGLAALGCVALGILGCSGSNTSAPAASTKLGYTNPTTSGYRLVADPSSTGTHLVLNLVGPSGSQIQGGTFTLTSDAAWSSTVAEGGALQLGSGVKLLKSQVKGSALEVAIYQKGVTAATLAEKPLFAVALDVKTGAKGPIALTATDAKILDAAGNTVVVPVAVGSLSAE